VLDAADRRLTEVRRDMPDAAGLVISSDHDTARAYAALLRRVTGTRPVVVLSDDKTASKKIAGFAQSEDRWMVAVRMVSEGVDIPRLAVGVFATSVSTALFFAQAVGRFVRARRRGETASVFLPSVPVLLGYAAELEAERDHVLHLRGDEDPERELAEAQRQRDTADDLGEPAFTALGASAHFDRVLYDGGEFGASAEEEEFIGLPGLLEPEQVALLLRKRRADQVKENAVPSQRAHAAAPAAPAVPAASAVPGAVPVLGARPVPVGSGAAPASASTRQVLAGLRKELNGLIAAWHHRTSQPHGAIHADLRRACGGPALPEATAEQIQARIEMLRRWASGR
jgi:superfamily II DNA or RNA helicase